MHINKYVELGYIFVNIEQTKTTLNITQENRNCILKQTQMVEQVTINTGVCETLMPRRATFIEMIDFESEGKLNEKASSQGMYI